MPALDEKTKRSIDGLSKEEIIYEINRGRESRFQREGFAYLKTRRSQIQEEESQNRQNIEIEHNQRTITLTEEANNISRKSNQLSKTAIGVSIGSLAVAVLALALAIYTFLNANIQP